MSGLNLTKYVGELASALLEAKLKMSDVTAAVEFCSVVHQKVKLIFRLDSVVFSSFTLFPPPTPVKVVFF